MLSVSSMSLRFEMDSTSNISWCNKEPYHSSLSISYFLQLVQCKPADVPCVLTAEINSPFVALETGKRPVAVGFKSQHNSRNRYDNGLILYCCRHDQRRQSLSEWCYFPSWSCQGSIYGVKQRRRRAKNDVFWIIWRAPP